jgi:hypothetical protein
MLVGLQFFDIIWERGLSPFLFLLRDRRMPSLETHLPTQGFAEITIKGFECLLYVEVSRLWSNGVMVFDTGSKAQYDVTSNSLIQCEEKLKLGDKILRVQR